MAHEKMATLYRMVLHDHICPFGLRARQMLEKGEAVYYNLLSDGEILADVAWSYPAPTSSLAALRGHLAFYASPLDGCFVDGERAVPQPGGFYGGWMTADLAGPFKGVAGSRFW